MGNSERHEPLYMIGPKGLERVVNALRVIAPELPFEIKFIELCDNYEEIRLNGYLIKAFKVNHKITCYGYSVEIERAGLFDVAKAEKNDIPKMYWSKLQKGEIIDYEGRRLTPDMVLGEPRKGIKITYTTDTRPTQSIIDNAKDADLFICEGMYAEKGDVNNAVKYRHMTFEEAAGLAFKAHVNQLWLTHYSPALNYPENYMDCVRAIFPASKAGKDGMSAELNFED